MNPLQLKARYHTLSFIRGQNKRVTNRSSSRIHQIRVIEKQTNSVSTGARSIFECAIAVNRELNVLVRMQSNGSGHVGGSGGAAGAHIPLAREQRTVLGILATGRSGGA